MSKPTDGAMRAARKLYEGRFDPHGSFVYEAAQVIDDETGIATLTTQRDELLKAAREAYFVWRLMLDRGLATQTETGQVYDLYKKHEALIARIEAEADGR